MNNIKLKKFLLLLVCSLLYVIAWFAQDQFLLKGDVSWQMHLARLVLSGGNYVNDFFEINPPLSIYLYMPAVLLQKKFDLSSIIALRIYIFLCATLSVAMCHFLLSKLFTRRDQYLHFIFLMMLIFVYLILPLDEFGQRECMSLYFTMPYFLLVSLRLDQVKVSFFPLVGIGIAAGLGFSIKPFFIFALYLVEMYFMFRQTYFKKFFLSWIRTETLCIFLIFIFYLIFINQYHPNYIKIVVPLAANFYYQFFSIPLGYVLFNPLIIYTALAPLFYFFLPINSRYNPLFMVLIMALIGFLAAYLAQQLPWYYHALPAFSIALIVYTVSFSLFLRSYRLNTPEFLFTLLLGLLIFFYPVHFIKNSYKKSIRIKEYAQPLINELKEKEKRKYVFFFSTKAAYMVSVLEHADALHASRLQFLAWMNRYYRTDKALSPQQQKDENFFVTLLVEDIKKNKPDLIYVDQFHNVTYQRKLVKLDYIKILSRHADFKNAWKAYHYWKTVDNPNMYQFDIYKRN